MKAALQAVTKSTISQTSRHNFDDDDALEKPNGQVVFSYNLAMTSNIIAICPRQHEAATIPTAGDTTGSVAINGTILGGTLMVKEEKDWTTLKQDGTSSGLLDEILVQIGYPRTTIENRL